MNRRDFFKIAGLGISGLFAPKWATERFGDEMQIGDLLAKLGRGETLTPAEQQQIRLWGNNAQLLNNFVQGIQSPEGGVLGNKINFPINKIYSSILGNDTASLKIEIPSIYTHLFIMASGRSTTGGTGNASLIATYNSDTGNNYETQVLYGASATAGAYVSGVTNYAVIGGLAKDGESAGVNGSGIVFIPNIRSGFYISSLSLLYPANSQYLFVRSCVWSSTENLKSIQLSADTGSIKAGSVISVYGLV